MYYLRNKYLNLLYPFPFFTLGEAEQHRVKLGAEGTCDICKVYDPEESEDEREARLDRAFENEVVERYIETGNETIQL